MKKPPTDRHWPRDVSISPGYFRLGSRVVEDCARRGAEAVVKLCSATCRGLCLDAEDSGQRMVFKEFPVQIERRQHDAIQFAEILGRPHDALSQRTRLAH